MSDGLVAPTGMTVGPDGTIYVANFGVFPDSGRPNGQVLRISMTPTGVSLTGFGGETSGSLSAIVLVPGALLLVAGATLLWRRRATNPVA